MVGPQLALDSTVAVAELYQTTTFQFKLFLYLFFSLLGTLSRHRNIHKPERNYNRETFLKIKDFHIFEIYQVKELEFSFSDIN